MTSKLKRSVLALLCAGVGVASALALVLVLRQIGSAPGAEADVDCLRMASEFTDYPLVFPGAEYDGLPLKGCARVQTPAKYDVDGLTVREPATDFFRFTYGECQLRGEQQVCSRPVQIFIDPPCGPSLDRSRVKETIHVRGVPVDVKPDHSLRIETPQFKATIYALDADENKAKAAAIRVAESLRGANALAQNLTLHANLGIALGSSSACP